MVQISNLVILLEAGKITHNPNFYLIILSILVGITLFSMLYNSGKSEKIYENGSIYLNNEDIIEQGRSQSKKNKELVNLFFFAYYISNLFKKVK